MEQACIRIAGAALGLALACSVSAQQVYRCEQADGSIVFSDLPCQSDVGREETVDATPHQGHRAPADPGAPAYEMPESPSAERDRTPRAPAGPATSRELSRSERLSLEQRRKQLLSALKRRHLAPGRAREMIDELRDVDRRLGIGPADVPDMPYHDQDVYDARRVYPGRSTRALEKP